MAAILCSHSRGDSDDERFGYFALALLRRYYSLQRRRALYLGRGMRREAGLESGIIPWGRQGPPMGDVPGVGRCNGCCRARRFRGLLELHLRCAACRGHVFVSGVSSRRRFSYLVWLLIRSFYLDRVDAIERLRLLRFRCSIRRLPS